MAEERYEGYCNNLARFEEELEMAEAKERWMDTSVLTIFHQRWPTLKLRDHLKKVYFERLSELIVHSTEVEMTKRRARRLREEVAEKAAEIRDREAKMKSLHSKHRRKEFLSLRRSALSKHVFGGERRKMLSGFLHRWRFFAEWHRGHRQAFELKTATYLNQIKAKSVVELIERKENIEYLTRPIEITGCVDTTTYMEDHQSRRIACRKCAALYTENHNHSAACQSHPGKKIGVGRDGVWSCCGKAGMQSLGCSEGYHLPPRKGHPRYVTRDLLNEGHDFLKSQKTKKLTEKMRQDGLADFRAKKSRLGTTADKLSEERRIVARHSAIKFV
mmetsp:Transcript_13721/g.40139  ORF Transcript_13721/g.40139 Transcript_13721/m.40139 type:complete len:331 (-) Transcript_13721:48-1040(-)